MGQHLVDAGFFDVEDFTFEGQNGLELTVASGFGRAAGGIALDEVELGAFNVAAGTIAEFAGQVAAAERPFAAGQFAGLAGRFPGGSGLDALVDDLPGDRRVFFHVLAQQFVDDGFDEAVDFGVHEPYFGLRFKLRITHFNGNNGDQSFAEIVTGGKLLAFVEVIVAGVAVEGTGQAGTKAADMGAAVKIVNVVGKGDDVFGIAGGVLHGDITFEAEVFIHFVQANGVAVQYLFAIVEVFDKGDDAGFKMVFFLKIVALVGQDYFQTGIEIGQLAQAGC